jgi:hypothetical protein
VSYSVRKYFTYFGLPYTASLEEVKAVYRKMAKRLHPDRNKSTNAHEEFTELQQNYDVLTKYIENGRRSTTNTYQYYQKPNSQPAPKAKKTRREIIQEKLQAKFNQSVNQYITSQSFRIGFIVDTFFDWFKLILAISVFLLFPIMSIISGSDFVEFIGITSFSSIFFLPIALFTYIGFNERNRYRKAILKAVKAKKNKL